MEFLNIGGGELLIIVLLAIVLFGPEDILKIMRTVGEYARKLQQIWATLRGELNTDDIVPAEIKETIKETKASMADLQKTLADISASAKADLSETQAAVEDIKTTLEEMSTSVAVSIGEAPEALKAALKEPTAGETSPSVVPAGAPPASDTPQAEGEPLAADAEEDAILITDTEPASAEVVAGQATPAADSPLVASPSTECESPTATLTPETQGNGEDI